jgi:hypothetical protein
MEGVGRGLSHGAQDVSSLGSTLVLGLTCEARVATLIEHPTVIWQ